jgi:hypothetical protein
MQTTFTIEEIRNYLEQQPSFADVFANLDAKNIVRANEKAKQRAKEDEEELALLEDDEFDDDEFDELFDKDDD